MELKKLLLAVGLVFLFFVGVAMAAVFGFGAFYKMTENRNFEKLRERSALNCSTMPYHCAARDRDVVKIRALVGDKVDVNTKDGWGSTALVYAVSWAPEMIEPLLEAGSDVTLFNDSGDDALAIAIRMRKFEIAKRLLEKGADINAKVGAGPKRNTRFSEAVIAKDLELMRFYQAHAVDLTLKDDYGYDGCERVAMYDLLISFPACSGLKKDPSAL
jgi:ankyrin repeat protein